MTHSFYTLTYYARFEEDGNGKRLNLGRPRRAKEPNSFNNSVHAFVSPPPDSETYSFLIIIMTISPIFRSTVRRVQKRG